MKLTAATSARLAQLGSRGAEWARALPAVLAVLERRFQCALEEPLEGGSAAFVARVRRRDGSAAVLKLAVPSETLDGDPFDRERAVLSSAPPGAYVSLLTIDLEHRALLLEALGPSLAALDLPVEEQLDALGAVLARGWCSASLAPSLPTCLEQISWLDRLFRDAAADPSCPCAPEIVARARTFLARRGAAFDLAHAVVIHADAHPHNVLASRPSGALASTGTTATAFQLIDPEGLRSSPEHDLAIPLREHNHALLAAADPTTTFFAWAHRIAHAAGGRDAYAIAEWAFLERVSSGLFLRSLQLLSESEPYLSAAARLHQTWPER